MAYAPTLRPRLGTWVAILLVNAALAALIQAAAPAAPKRTDRNDYDYNSTQPLTAFCPNTIYCYRILVPMLLELAPVDQERRWRVLQWLAHTATGSIVAVASMPAGSPWIATVSVGELPPTPRLIFPPDRGC